MNSVPYTPHDFAQRLAQKYSGFIGLNEATTRHQIIDVVLHQVLSWPTSAVVCEEHVSPGYADYVLSGRREKPILVIEAKKDGIFFQLPPVFNDTNDATKVRLKTLVTDEDIRKAVNQARRYAIELGCQFAAITNGHQWIFFKTFAPQSNWLELNAFVVPNLHYFAVNFTAAVSALSYGAIADQLTLSRIIGTALPTDAQLFHTKEHIPSYNQEVTTNHLAPLLRPLAERFLGTIDEHDDEFMEFCYVNRREYEISFVNMQEVVYNSLSPYFISYNVKEFFDDGLGGELGKRITSSARDRRTRDVVIMYGAKGSGKSTFVRKLLYHRPPKEIQHFAVVALIDLVNCEEDKMKIEDRVWTDLLKGIDVDNVLDGTREQLLELFHDEFTKAERQVLVGLNKSSDLYNDRLNSLVKCWLSDRAYCSRCLSDYWKKKRKGLIVVLDNTDQFEPKMQDYCFVLAKQISEELDCLVIVSMREERFYYSRFHGTLDAFQTSGFHLSSPPSSRVFQKRLDYILKVLEDPEYARKVAPQITDDQANATKSLFGVLRREFGRKSSDLSVFLRHCAHGDMRRALSMFREFLTSGYTRVDEMIRTPGWRLQVHQVVRPMMAPIRFFYDENLSQMPNIYQIRSGTIGSHFTALRILKILSEHTSTSTAAFVPMATLRSYFSSIFDMLDDLEKNLDILLRKGLIESNNRIDVLHESIESLRISTFGRYLFNNLCFRFNYVDLVCLDCAVHDEAVARSLARLAERDIGLYYESKKVARLKVRLRRAREFISHLSAEERREAEVYGLDASECVFTARLADQFQADRARIVASARKRYRIDPSDDVWE